MLRLGRYEIGGVLGEGGAGRVHRAERLGPGELRTPVAVKILHRGGRALRREARIGGLLRHRNLVDMYEVGEVDGTWFCAMELCRGSLVEHLPLPPRAVVDVALQVCGALQYAHEALGLVHQDLKPANLLLDDRGVVKVADLGIARAEGFELGGIRGTPGYAAPEQSFGTEVDARADVYALGVTLVELATGRRSRSSATPDLTVGGPAAHTSSTMSLEDLEPVELDTIGVPDWLAPVVGRCLEPDPADRWPDMAALAAALRSLVVTGPGLREVLGLPTQADDDPRTGAGNEFVGRGALLEQLAACARTQPGPCTLLGPPGIGKSRLAAVAAERHRQQGGRAWVCDLADAVGLEALCSAVARTLSVALDRGDPIAQLGRVLSQRGPAVLILDNVEHLAPFLAPVARAFCERAPQLRLWLTSRVTLDLGPAVRVAALPDDSAVALLAARARERGVELGDEPQLLELAQRLDGLPLALELAAGRLGVLSVGDVLERLDLSLLRTGSDDRHGTLHAALDWSWALLSDTDRSALAQLSVFAGGFTLAAAERVVALDDVLVLEALRSLADRSMVSTDRGTRLRLLASVRAYAAEKLVDGGAAEARHGRWCAELGRESGPRGSTRQLRALGAELDNLVVACRRAVARGDGEVALGALEGAWATLARSAPGLVAVELAEAVEGMLLPPAMGAQAALAHARTLWSVGRMDRARERVEVSLALARAVGDRSVEADASRVLGALWRQLGHIDEARTLQEAARELYRSLGDDGRLSIVLDNLGLLYQSQGQLDEAGAYFTEALERSRVSENRATEAGALSNLALLHDYRGRPDEALAHYREALAVFRELADRRREGQALGNLGAMWRGLGRLDDAQRAYEEALAIHRAVGNRRFEGRVLGNLGTLHFRRGDAQRARRYWQEALEVHREVGNRSSVSIVLGNLAELCREEGRLDEARVHCDAALAIAREVGERRAWVWLLTTEAQLDQLSGDLDAAHAHLDEAEPMAREVRDPVLTTAMLCMRATVLAQQGRRQAGLATLAEAEALVTPGHVDAQSAIEDARAALAALD